ncbi:MAG: hypothetical protein V3T59_04480 [Desulfobacterales bacterium]
MQTRFRERRKHVGLQPPRRFVHRTRPDKAGGSSEPERLDFVMPIDRAGKTKAGAYRFKLLSEKERREFSQREKEVRTYRKKRQVREAQRQYMLEKRVSKKPEPNKEKFSRSPIMYRSNEKANRKKAPPARYKPPKPNPDVEPLQRKYDLSRSWNKSRKSEDIGQKSVVKRFGVGQR